MANREIIRVRKNRNRHTFLILLGVVCMQFILLTTGSFQAEAQIKKLTEEEKEFMKKPVKWGYIQSTKILKLMPEYQEAQYQTDTLLIGWKKQLKGKIDTLNMVTETYEKERLSLPVEERAKREELIAAKKDSLDAFQEFVFGDQGLYFKKKTELIQIAMEKLFKATDEVAKKQKLHLLFDRDRNKHIVWVSPIHDYSDYVMEELKLGDPIDTIKQNK